MGGVGSTNIRNLKQSDYRQETRTQSLFGPQLVIGTPSGRRDHDNPACAWRNKTSAEAYVGCEHAI
jgi:hypothetical protein